MILWIVLLKYEVMQVEHRKDNKGLIELLTDFGFEVLLHDNKYPKGKPKYSWDGRTEVSLVFDKGKEYYNFDLRHGDFEIKDCIHEMTSKSEYFQLLSHSFDSYQEAYERLATTMDKYRLLEQITNDLSRLNFAFKNCNKELFDDEFSRDYEISLFLHFAVIIAYSGGSNSQAYREDGFLIKKISTLLRTKRDFIEATIDFLNKKLEVLKSREDKHQTSATLEQTKSFVQKNSISWAKSDTDLLELITALNETRSIKRDGNSLTRKEVVEFFSAIFNIQIIDSESKHSRATERKKDVSPFLSSLKQAFDDYANNKL